VAISKLREKAKGSKSNRRNTNNALSYEVLSIVLPMMMIFLSTLERQMSAILQISSIPFLASTFHSKLKLVPAKTKVREQMR
jgi:hypothetical protein